MAETPKPVLAIICGGGPAPGINGVIAAVTIEAIYNRGWDVIGVLDGFSHIMEGDRTHIIHLNLNAITRIHFNGGSILRTSRANPTKEPRHLANCVEVLKSLGVRYLVTIGGDDTALSSNKVAEASNGAFAVCHVPKTIDNDLPLIEGVPTFGYETAREVGADLVQNLLADTQTTGRWFIVVAMGRTAGHLAMGIGKAAGATLTIISEEFMPPKIKLPEGVAKREKTEEEKKAEQAAKHPVKFRVLCDIIESAVYKRLALGKDYGVVVLAEGLVEAMPESEIQAMVGKSVKLSRDGFNNLKLDDIDFGMHVRNELRRRMKERDIPIAFSDKKVGYELRCSAPLAFDREYTRNLGYGAVRFLAEGKTAALITFDGDHLVPMPFSFLKDPDTGKTKVRMVDTASTAYIVHRKYQVRLALEDLEDSATLRRIAEVARTTPADIAARFGYLVGFDVSQYPASPASPRRRALPPVPLAE